MGEVITGRFETQKRFAPVGIGDMVVGRMLYGEHRGRWVVMEIAGVDSDGAITTVRDPGGDDARLDPLVATAEAQGRRTAQTRPLIPVRPNGFGVEMQVHRQALFWFSFLKGHLSNLTNNATHRPLTLTDRRTIALASAPPHPRAARLMGHFAG